MRIIKRKTLLDFYSQKRYLDSEQGLRTWFSEVSHENWENSNDVKAKYATASIVGDSRIVFNICGNKYRLVVRINYDYQIVYIRFIGTHKQYDSIDVTEV
ncbi:MAG: type II toxin-antitoxin system HigB family toxin [Fibrobacterales bacterium]